MFKKWFLKRGRTAFDLLCVHFKHVTIYVFAMLVCGIFVPVYAQNTDVTVEITATLRLRSGPGTEFPTIATMRYPAQVTALNVNESQTWVKVDYNGIVGWAANQYLRVVSGSLGSLVGLPVGNEAPAPNISFWGDRTNIDNGECVTLTWDVENIDQVYYQGEGVTGHGNRVECPTTTATYTLRVLLRDGSWSERSITVNVATYSSPTASYIPDSNYLIDSLSPNYPQESLVTGFLPDPYGISMISGGEVDATYLGGDCVGYATSAPDFTFDYQSSGDMLRIYFVADNPGTDTTLIINDPNGSWWCNDDSFETLNPSLRWDNALSGEYDVWVGGYTSDGYYPGTLFVTEVGSNHP